MFDFAKMFGQSLDYVASDRVVLATPYDLPEQVARDLKLENRLACFIADSVDHAERDSCFGGWWVDRQRGRIFLRRAPGATLLVAGIADQENIAASMLLEARLKGFRRIVTTNMLGAVVEDLNVSNTLEDRLDSALPGPRIGALQYDAAFEDMLSLIGNALRIDKRAFEQNRVALVIGSLGPGGAERQASLTAIGLKLSDSYDPVLICNNLTPPGDFFLKQVEDAGVSVREIDPLPPELNLPEIKRTLAVLGERYPALRMTDIVYEVVRYAASLRAQRPSTVHLWMDYCSVLGGAAAYLVGIPKIVFGGRSMAPNRFNIFQPFMRTGYHALLKRTNPTMLNNSRAGAEDYCAFLNLPPGRIRVIHNGFEFPDPAPTARLNMRGAHGIDAGAKVVGSILRFSEEKRPRLLIEMARSISARAPHVRFMFFGDGPLLHGEREYVEREQLSGIVKLPGYVNPTADALAAFDMFVLASRMEGLPNVLIEAQAAGLPIVCTGVGGMNETFDHGVTGFAVPSATPDDLATKVLDILEDESRLAKMAADARAYATARFGIAQMIAQTVDAYGQSDRANIEVTKLGVVR